MVTIIEVQTNARGIRAGDGHNWTKWPRSIVDEAIAMRAGGAMYRDIRDELRVPITTLWTWCTGKRRQPPVRVVVKRVKERGSFGVNHQRAMSANVDQPEKQACAHDPATAPSDPLLSPVPSPANRRGEP